MPAAWPRCGGLVALFGLGFSDCHHSLGSPVWKRPRPLSCDLAMVAGLGVCGGTVLPQARQGDEGAARSVCTCTCYT